MELEDRVGNQGTFYYPKLDLIATSMVVKDIPVLSKAHEEDKTAILKIRENLNIIRVEELRKKEITIHYETKIDNLDQWNLKDVIANAKSNYLKFRNLKKVEAIPDIL